MTSQLSLARSGGTVAERTYQALRDGIELGRLLPGERITERAVAADLGVSPTPVREAIRRLEQERLIERTSPRMVRVSQPSPEVLRELAYTEAALRGVAARFAASKITDDEIIELESLVETMETAYRTGDSLGVLPAAARFDVIVEQASGNDIVASLAANITAFGPNRRQRAITEMINHDTSAIESRLSDHRDILDALRAKDPDRAEMLMKQHILTATRYFIELGP
ncbi:GntR family transcriptional regulator [Rhodococcus sp. 1R11]|uniref:GntR family transcriptional regulator n=1 Tax=Rhodococcus sp. 1R11 TaxID=2559614 RepID=UPI001072945E|nr:GntR family transcriptional regulator [Rhodococcus sp. 1R11]TFI40414.1 GntR family transcriptional regulator [Rhodococcus sp. 1R11]